MADKLADDDYPAEPYGALLAFLSEQEWPGIEDLMRGLVDVDLSDSRHRGRAGVAARILWLHADDFSWPLLGPRFLANPTFAAEVVASVASEHWGLQGSAWDEKHEDSVAKVYAWMVEQFPEAHDPPLTERMGDTERYKIGQLRHSLLVNLQARGTPSSLAALIRLRAQFPDEASLPNSIGFAREHVAEAAWRPLAPRHVLHLRRTRPGEPLLVSVLKRLTILEMQRVAAALGPGVADDIAWGSSTADAAHGLFVEIVQQSALTEACRQIQAITRAYDDDLARLLSRQEGAHA